jgi:hypothetical protein
MLNGSDLCGTGSLLKSDFRRFIIPDLSFAIMANDEGRGRMLAQRKAKMSTVDRLKGTSAAHVWRHFVVALDDLFANDTAILGYRSMVARTQSRNRLRLLAV